MDSLYDRLGGSDEKYIEPPAKASIFMSATGSLLRGFRKSTQTLYHKLHNFFIQNTASN